MDLENSLDLISQGDGEGNKIIVASIERELEKRRQEKSSYK